MIEIIAGTLLATYAVAMAYTTIGGIMYRKTIKRVKRGACHRMWCLGYTGQHEVHDTPEGLCQDCRDHRVEQGIPWRGILWPAALLWQPFESILRATTRLPPSEEDDPTDNPII